MLDDALSILLIDDDDVSRDAVTRNLRRGAFGYPIIEATDGQEALAMLRDGGAIHGPLITLLDINMPRMDGFDFLNAIRADPDLRKTVVFMFTTSDTDRDRDRAYHANVAGYIVKTKLGPGYVKLIDLLNSYRSSIRLP